MARSLILVSLGTHEQPFPRALDLVEPLARNGMDLVVQHGSTPPRPQLQHVSWKEFIPFAELAELMGSADSVICHAGVGTIITAIKAGHVPVVIPRRAAHCEHVDDHQLDIARKFAGRGLLRCVSGDDDLEPMLTPRGQGTGAIGAGSQTLRDAVRDAVGGAR
jgi:UDP-N-acetylglucosamine--N-acetylmuramyl-(pentapeptide) pyrophosphoryl-undecaprenol N-acetylglucosamine transferase